MLAALEIGLLGALVLSQTEQAHPLDLTRFYHTPASRFEKIRSHPWRAVPRGSQTLGNVPLAMSQMVWRDKHPDNDAAKLRFFITPVPNPRPALEVKSISLVSAKGNSAACILAMTTGPAGLLRVDKVGDR